jgi:hypothetical protein
MGARGGRGQPDTVPLRLGPRTEANGKNSVPSSPRPRSTSIVSYSAKYNPRRHKAVRCAVAVAASSCRACHQFSWRAVGPAKIQVNNASAHDSLDGQACIWSTKYKLSVALPINEHGLLQIEFRYWEDLMLASASVL